MRRALVVGLAAAGVLACAAPAAVFTVEPSPSAPLLQPAGFAVLPSAEMPNAPGAMGLAPLLAIPPFVPEVRSYPQLLDLWQQAGAAYGVPWQVLAAVNKVESDFGRNMGPSSAGAIGWMQFMPSTWEMWGTDANGDGVADPWNPEDAVFSAARYLAGAGAGEDLYRAVYAYNHADWYVQEVLDLASSAAVADMTFPLPAGAAWTRGGGADSHRAGGRGDNWESLNAVDIMAEPGTPVLAVFAGIVSDVSAYESPHVTESGAVVSGASVSLMSFDGTEAFYAHVDSVSVVVGQAVSAGQVLAAVAPDTPGGPHLHFALEAPLDPEAIFGDPAFDAPFLSSGFGLARVFARADLQEQIAGAWRQVRRARLAVAQVEEELARQEAESGAVEQAAGDPALTVARFREYEATIAGLAAAQEHTREVLAERQSRLTRAFARLERLRSEASTVSFTSLVPLVPVAAPGAGAASATRTLATASAQQPALPGPVFTIVGRTSGDAGVVGFTR